MWNQPSIGWWMIEQWMIGGAGSAESKEWNKINEINLIEFLRPAGASNWFGLGWLNCCGLWAAAQPMLRNNESKLNTKPKGRNEWNGTASRGRKLCFSLRAAVKWSEMEQRGPEASTQPSLHSIKIKLSILFFFHSVKLALLKGIKIYYNSNLRLFGWFFFEELKFFQFWEEKQRRIGSLWPARSKIN